VNINKGKEKDCLAKNTWIILTQGENKEGQIGNR
jgi:hypothetical protein